jgi:hypothetical protein
MRKLERKLTIKYISGVLPERARLDAAGVNKVNLRKLVYCYQSSLKAWYKQARKLVV